MNWFDQPEKAVRYISGTRRRSRLYACWTNMKGRCYNEKNPKFARYGGRGIRVDQAWKDDFQTFAEWSMTNGYRDELTLDRKHNDLNYYPENCQWATAKTQARNRSTSRVVRAFGTEKTLAEWMEDPRCGVSHHVTIGDRLNRGWIPEDAISTPKWERGEVLETIRKAEFSASPVFSDVELGSEKWEPIPQWTFYEASDLGRVRSSWGSDPKILKITHWKDGRPKVNLYSETVKCKPFSLAYLVLLSHVGPRPEGLDACHFPDPNPKNCRLANLRWDTQAENSRDRTRFNKLMLEIIKR